MNDYITLSFDKLESFDMHRSSLTSFVLIRNSLISALTRQENNYNDLLYRHQEQVQVQDSKENCGQSDDGEQEVWLASCFDQLDQDEANKPSFDEYDSEEDEYEYDEDDSMPSSPQENTTPFYKQKPTFFINEEDEEDGLICYDIPFLSL
ncbi:hypothetical protein BD408DRAFT_444115 [Parasitella parasitica]|nr:hypothetical protein BD408DRAFT_444115 [Parasitella parasitica]